ncbi:MULTISPECIES: hypothetical protein [Aurantimonas]|uniref:hypothetical protein n=1 Tax=Aurantimonas TaxID=182269 RepID=UPI0035188C22
MNKPRAGIHRIVEEVIEAIGEKESGHASDGTQIVASFLGVSKSTVYKWTDDGQDGEISYLKLCQLVDRFGVSVPAEHMARLAGGVFVPLDATKGDARYMRTLREIGEGLQTVASDITRALEDNGKIDRPEVAALHMREHIASAIAVLAAHDLHLKAIAEDAEPATVVPMKAGAR